LPRLDWIPNRRTLRAPRQILKQEFERDWFNNLRDAMFDNLEMQGYLPKTDDLWRIAGARTRAFWNANCAAVMACFSSATVSGQEVIFLQSQLEVMDAQREKLRGTKRARASPSHSQSVFDFEVQNQRETVNVGEVPYGRKPSASERDRETKRNSIAAITKDLGGAAGADSTERKSVAKRRAAI
jgi:hypothetical protein